MYIRIDLNKCTVCGACVSACPADAVSIRDGVAVVDDSKCTLCKRCMDVCPTDAIYEVSGSEIVETKTEREKQALEIYEAEPVSVVGEPERNCLGETAMRLLPRFFDMLIGLFDQGINYPSGRSNSLMGKSASPGKQRRRRQQRGGKRR